MPLTFTPQGKLVVISRFPFDTPSVSRGLLSHDEFLRITLQLHDYDSKLCYFALWRKLAEASLHDLASVLEICFSDSMCTW